MKEFTKSDLKDDMVVEYRDGGRRLVIQDRLTGIEGYSTLESYEDSLNHVIYKSIDIVKVYKLKKIVAFGDILEDCNLELIWKRKEITPVCFIDAVKAFNKGKTIYCDTPNLGKFYYNGKSNKRLTDDQGRGITPWEILEGAWYIEE